MNSKTRILFVRHGQTDWNVQGRWQGHEDIPLNKAGREQAKALAGRLSSWPVAAIYSSDLRRAAETAEILGHSLGLRPTVDSSWRERSGGELQGMSREILRAEHVTLLARIRAGEAPPGGESNLQVAKRAADALEKIVQRHAQELVVVVTHGGTLNLVLAHILGLPLGERARVSVSGNTGLTLVEYGEYGPYVSLLNDTCHLNDGGNQGKGVGVGQGGTEK